MLKANGSVDGDAKRQGAARRQLEIVRHAAPCRLVPVTSALGFTISVAHG